MTDDESDPGEPAHDEEAPGESGPDERDPAADPVAWSGPNDGGTDGDEAVSATSGDGGAADGEDGDARPGDAARRDEGSSSDEEAPLSDLAASVEGGRDAGTGPLEGGRFEEQDVAPIDADAVWERIEGEDPGSVFDGDAADASFEGDAPDPRGPDAEGREPDAEGREADVEGEERDVDASEYCKRCPHFSTPPEVRCTHPGTEIAEVLDVDRFRVVDCPKVRETDRLERL